METRPPNSSAPARNVETVVATESPTGIPRHAYETPIFKIREGVTDLHWASWPRIDDAIESYGLFRRLREEGVIRSHLRFQVCLPFPSSVLIGFKADFAADYPIASRGFENLVGRELQRLMAEVPPEDLAIQWDVCWEVLDLEGRRLVDLRGRMERFTGPVERLTRLIPEETLVGYHLCYGTFPEWPMYEAGDMGLMVRMANYAVANSGRRVDWLHLAGPRYLRSEDERSFRPLADPTPATPASSSGSCCPSTVSPASSGGTAPPPGSSRTSP